MTEFGKAIIPLLNSTETDEKWLENFEMNENEL